MTDSNRSEQQFPTTRWTVVGVAGLENGSEGRAALSDLITRYLPPLRAFLARDRGLPPDEVDDLLQEFVTTKFLEQNLAAHADRSRGRFRFLLLAALRNFLVSAARNRRAGRRSPAGRIAPIDDLAAEHPANDATPASGFNAEWARQILRTAVARMEAECRASGQGLIWEVFRLRILAPATEGLEPLPYQELVRQLGFQSPTQASNALITAKRMFHRYLRIEIGAYAESDAAIDDEIQDLREALS